MTEELLARVNAARDEAVERIAAAGTLAELRDIEVATTGRKAQLSELKSGMAGLPADQRPVAGKAIQEALRAVEGAIAERRGALEAAEESASLAGERLDVTLPGRAIPPGHPHPISLMMDRIVDVFIAMGYRVAEGPEVETDWYAFGALNMPEDHPALSMWDTLYLQGAEALLRPHTSPVQIRAMEKQPPPIYIVAPGRTFRRDAFDASHSPVFHQVEGLAVDRGISFADLKGTLDAFARQIFGAQLATRFRPSYFPFTEPSAEMDVACPTCEGAGCSACGRSGWIELLGSGMVHPSVLKNAGYDPETYTGFAFGMGVERIAMRAFGVPDLRQLFDNDVRFLARFAG
ncbi:MAG: phenylalanine--tRNA ligase subunit alpha [Actinomycetota bacterium]